MIQVMGRALRRWARLARLDALDLRDRLLGRRDLLVPPRRYVDGVGGFDFRLVGQHLAAIAIDHGKLGPSERILDIGCGVGRLAVPLTSYLTTGEYVGFDIARPAIGWCLRAIAAHHPRFWFRLVDVANSHYNVHGKVRPDEFQFPCADRSVDVAFAASVFTHLSPLAAEHYLSEVARVLKVGGRGVLSFFLFDSELKPRLSTLGPRFPHFIEPFCAVADRDDPEAAIAYDLDVVTLALERHGFEILGISRGAWAGFSGSVSFQDFVFVRRVTA
ncbi:MAG: methyltransferase domain-containing protein [Thermoanaerobaculia bacterium]